jgi:hypothetical protein
MTSENQQPEIYASTHLLLRHLHQIGPEQIEEWIRWATDSRFIEPTGGQRYNITARGQGILGPPDYST